MWRPVRAGSRHTVSVEFTVGLDGGEVVGQDTGGEGVPVVLLHPGWGDSTIWDPVTALLPESARVICYDVRGYGRSPAPTGPFTAVGDLAAVLSRLDVVDAIVVGHSGGGATAVSLTLVQPDRVRALILAAPGVSDYPWPENDPYFVECDTLLSARDREGLTALGLRTWAAADADPQAEDQIRRAVDAMLAQGDHLQDDPPAMSRLDQIRVPTEVVIGDQDHPMVVDCAEVIAARIPRCRLTFRPGADHMLPLREPAVLAQLIAAHLD